MTVKEPKTIYSGPQKALEELQKLAEQIYEQLSGGIPPHVKFPSRTKDNIVFDPNLRVWKYGKRLTERSVKTLRGAYMFLRMMYVIDFIREMIEANKSSTLRELYYISEGWGVAKFHSQQESDRLVEDLEIMTRLLREDFKLRPEENGAAIIGDITIEEVTRSGDVRRIHCQDDVGDAGYNIPAYVEPDKIRFVDVGADFVIAIETGGMFDRLVENRFDETHNAILVHLKGQPARSTRRIIKRMNEELGLPVVVFTDGDPWSFRIYASIAYGAIKTAHISEYLATPDAKFLGVTPSDIINYELPTDKLTQRDIKALHDELKDPRFSSEFWQSEIRLQLKLGKKAEQQALAKYGLDYVTKVYLPEKLSEMGILKR
ncbi:MAG TPA: DNA topoisomerase IV subunit A [Thermoprotei archaeon]|nr:DNA topoisomerase IV subunit A [Euryarchaeota archaeon]MCD6158517.1 DNA topoisomerase IV subunit A [Euryarchaeota archaeon]HDJ50965.1 DNA topoisomerase IV subunit A [Thermoprotei archaeon]